MCIAIYQPTDTEDISKDRLYRCRQENPDGMGMMWVEGGQIKFVKQLKRFGKFYRRYLKVRELGIDVVLHFRIGTHGANDIENCHPFMVKPGLAFCHNGIITQHTPAKILNKEAPIDLRSDTRLFNEEVLQKLPDEWQKNPGILKMLSDYVGYSKLVIMDLESVYLVNDCLGVWDKGVWYSNDSYRFTAYNYIDKRSSVSVKGLDTDFRYEGKDYVFEEGYTYDDKVYCADCLPSWHRMDIYDGHVTVNCHECGTLLSPYSNFMSGSRYAS